MERRLGRRHARHRARTTRPRRRVQFADGALLVSWSPPANEGSAITDYDLQIGGGASAIQRIGNTTTFRWEGLTNGQEYTFMVRAVNAKGEGQFSSASAPEHPLRPPDAPAAPTGERGDKTINVRWSPPRQRWRPGHRVRGADPLDRRHEPHHRHVAAAGPTCPTASPSSSRCGPATGPGGAPTSAASAAVVPCGVPDQTGGVTAVRADGAATVSWGAPGQPGLRHHRLHGQDQPGAVDERRRRRDVDDVRRAEQRHQLHVHGRGHATRSAPGAAQRRLQRRRRRPACPGAADADQRHARHRPGRPVLDARPTTTAVPSPTTSCPSTAAPGSPSAPARRRRAPAWPTARRTRSRCAP